ncbi:hypothetical protein F4553_002159 [Allocatelliglobosispora scoriae]|uniref:WD40 repeat domain-containing protein n=1 Tax=Allocatelliglobosispora scoriae TaxID=643052 RepID=A0A841BPN6_9ACTN|nr:PD40 domain-containing protein [Allocatelliglobosispora scoriae]MBB5868780.1 hypothetical protein [Allocatelliglobosispora scoriae]
MKTFLAELAEEAPVARASVDVMWHAGRRRRRRTRALTVAAAVAALAAAIAPVALPGTAPRPRPADGELPALPRSVSVPYLWHRTLGEAPNGPALAVLGPMRKILTNVGDDPLDLPGQLARTGATVVIGQDGSYRLIHGAAGPVVLSPDGRHLAESASVEEGVTPLLRLIDLTSGTAREVPGDLVLAWWPDSSRLLARDSLGALISIDTATLVERTIALPGGIVGAAVSPDGTRIAYEVDPQPGTPGWHALIVSDVRGLPEARWELSDSQRLAGPAAWAPDGRSVALLDGIDDEDRSVLRWDIADGRATSLGSMRGRPPQQVVGWRGGRPVLTVGDGRTENVSVGLLRADGTLETLMTTDGSSLQLPQQLVNRDVPSGPPLDPPTFEPATWFCWVVGTAALIIAALATVLIRLRRRRRQLGAH